MASRYGVEMLPAHYRGRRRRGRHLPPMVGHKIVRGHYRYNPAMAVGGYGGATFMGGNPRRHHRNPGGGTNWTMIILLAGAAWMFLGRGAGFGGLPTSITPAGYTYLGSGYYRGPDGQVYLRGSSGQLSPASNQSAAEAQLQTLGIQTATGVAGAAIGGLSLLLKGAINSLFAPTSGGPTAVAPSISDPTVTAVAPSSDVAGMTAAETPMPEAAGVAPLPPMDSAAAAAAAGIADPLAPQGP